MVKKSYSEQIKLRIKKLEDKDKEDWKRTVKADKELLKRINKLDKSVERLSR